MSCTKVNFNTYCMFQKSKYISFTLVCLFLSCNHLSNKMTDEQVQRIKKDFTPEEIIYFYETAFFLDSETRDFKPFQGNTKIAKWDKDIIIKTFGEITKKDSDLLNETIAYLNELNLPVKLYLSGEENHNLRIYYGNKVYLEKATALKLSNYFKANNGFGYYAIDSISYIKNAIIGINNAIDLEKPYETNVILEELSQILGIPGDSYSKINSVFYQADKNLIFQKKLLEIDERILQLLYSNDINTGLTIDEFYRRFRDIIPMDHITSEDYREFEEYIAKHSFSNQAIQIFCKTAFAEGNYIIKEPHIQKWHNDISFMFSDKFKVRDSIAISNSLNLLSEFIKEPKISRRENKNCNANLLIGYHKIENSSDRQAYIGRDMLNYQIYKANLLLPNSDFFSDNFYQKIITRNLLNILGLGGSANTKLEINETIFFGNLDNLEPVIARYDKEVLQLFFSETLKSGMVESKLLEILLKYYSIE